jgi:hypothetical protein
MIDALRVLVAALPTDPREIEVIRARVAGGEPVERVAEEYRVEAEAIVAVCRLPMVLR